MKTSQSLLRNASSPDRGALGRPGQPCCSHRPNRAQSAGPCPNGQQLQNCALTKDARQAAVNLDSGARSFPIAENFTRPVQPSPARQWLPYQGSWREAPERLYKRTLSRRFAPHLYICFLPWTVFSLKTVSFDGSNVSFVFVDGCIQVFAVLHKTKVVLPGR